MKPKFRRAPLPCLAFVTTTTFLAVALLGTQAEAADFFWIGGAGNNNANNGSNWNPGDPANNSNADIFFTDTATTSSMHYNPNANRTWNSITFSRDDNFNITYNNNTGIAGTFGGGITAAASGTTLRTYSILDEFRVAADQTWTTSNQYSQLVVNQAVGNLALGSNTLTLDTFGNADSTITIGSSISGNGSIIKSGGTGTAILSGTNIYSGATSVNAGRLTVSSSGAINNTSGVSIGAGDFNYNSATALTQAVSFSGTSGTLSGSGTINNGVNVTTGNTLSVGNSTGTMNFGSDLTLGGTYLFELIGGASGADLVNVMGNLDLSGGILDLVQLGTYTPNDKFTLFGYDGSLTGTFTGIADDSTFSDAGGIWQINYNDASAGLNGGTGNNFVTITAVPEPAAVLLGSLGALLLLRRRRG